MSLSRLALAALAGLLAVAIGAATAHGPMAPADPVAAGWIDTAQRYHLFHSLALLAVALLPRPSRWRLLCGCAFLCGLLLFSGGLYLKALAGADLGPLVPLGGLAYMIGWLALFLHAIAGRRT